MNLYCLSSRESKELDMWLHKFLGAKIVSLDMGRHFLYGLFLEIHLGKNTMILLNILILEFYIHPALGQSAWASKDRPL